MRLNVGLLQLSLPFRDRCYFTNSSLPLIFHSPRHGSGKTFQVTYRPQIDRRVQFVRAVLTQLLTLEQRMASALRRSARALRCQAVLPHGGRHGCDACRAHGCAVHGPAGRHRQCHDRRTDRTGHRTTGFLDARRDLPCSPRVFQLTGIFSVITRDVNLARLRAPGNGLRLVGRSSWATATRTRLAESQASGTHCRLTTAVASANPQTIANVPVGR